MRYVFLIGMLGLTGWGRHALPFTRRQRATVHRAVDLCTSASGALTTHLKKSDHAGAENAAIAARNGCLSSRAKIVAAVGTGTILDACYFAVDRQKAMQRAELASLDTPTLENGKVVLMAIDDAIRQQTDCSTAMKAAAQGAS